MAFLSAKDLQHTKQANFPNRQILAEAKTASVSGSVFLSHSSKDDDKVDGVVLFLHEHGAKVYTDDTDERLPNPPSTDTAKILKGEIQSSARFIVLVSPNSRLSRWIPWELGLADAFKATTPIAILPFTHDGNEDQWAKEEYFGLYPRIYKSENEWRVLFPEINKYRTLKNWLG
jgi:hypothetical protein